MKPTTALLSRAQALGRTGMRIIPRIASHLQTRHAAAPALCSPSRAFSSTSNRKHSAPPHQSSSSPKPTPATTTTTILEVERKFAPTPLSTHLLQTNTGGPPPFTTCLPRGTATIADTYYDTAPNTGLLTAAGVWLRQRGGAWEAKVRVGGNYTNSAFEELTAEADISALLARLVPGATTRLEDLEAGAGAGEVREVARFVSQRQKFLVDGRFTVVLDATDFGHVVGEVELERALPAAVRGEERAEVVAEMDREIDQFMRRYGWAFPVGKPVGKLSAYFALKGSG